MAYEHIRRLDEKALALADTEIPALREVIADYRQYLPEENWKAFQARVAREWAIETGQIEGLYQFDRGVTIELIEHGITLSRIPASASQMSPEQVMAILSDHLTTLEGLFAFVKGERALSKSYIHEVHQALLRNQKVYRVFAAVTQEFFEKELVSGRYKDQPNSPTRPDGSVLHFCPPEQVEAEMDQLMRFHREHEAEGVPVEIQAAWLHHAFTHIHPYPDGNGRVARALATLVLIKGGLMPLVVPTNERERVYIHALERADENDYAPLVSSFRQWQGRLVVELSERVDFGPPRQVSNLSEFMTAVEHDLVRNEIQLPGPWTRDDVVAGRLLEIATKRLQETAAELSDKTRAAGGWRFVVQGSGSAWASALVAPLGFKLRRSQAIALIIETGFSFRLLASASAVGSKRRGLSLVVAHTEIEEQAELLGEPFLATHAEDTQQLSQRVESWFEDRLLDGLKRWRKLQFK